jgi:hypothetical protein
MQVTQHVLHTLCEARRIDLYFPETRFAIEIKIGLRESEP